MEKNVNRPHKGMIQDNNPVDQPKESYRYALNAINETSDGNRTLLSNEKSNDECWSLFDGYFPIGKVYTVDNKVVIFSTNGTNSQIGIVKDCVYDIAVNSECLNFSIEHQIDATYRVRNGCETVIYFTDGYNPVRSINLDKLSDYYTDAYKAWVENPIGPEPSEKYDCDLFALIPPYQIPCFSEAEIINGGKLLSGSYNFAIQYLDADFNPTPWVTVSRPINIYTDSINISYLNIDGSSNIESDALGGTANFSNKAIQLTLTNLDESYTYYKIAAIQATSFNGLVTSVIASDEIPISQTTFIFDGNPSNYTEISLTDIYPSRINLEYAQHIEQLENRLILANTKGKQVNFCSFQKYASKIASHYIIKDVEDTNVLAEGNPKNPLSPFECVGFMGGEVYAFGIVYVFKDGFESPAYHIPGPPVNKRWDWNANTCRDVVTDYGQLPDDYEIETWNQDIQHIVPQSLETDYNDGLILPYVQRWRVNETAIPTSLGIEGHMAFWECSTSTYDKRESCDGSDYWGNDFCGDPLEGTKVRHHRFPSRTLEPHVNNDGGIDTYYNIIAKIKLVSGVWPNPGNPIDLYTDYKYNTIPKPTVLNVINESDLDPTTLEYTVVVAVQLANAPMLITDVVCNLDPLSLCVLYPTDFEVTYTVEFAYQNSYNYSSLKLLGVQFDNIEYPHPDIVGHYFVRAERDEFNRTILDSAIANKMRELETKKFYYVTFSYFTQGNVNGSYHNYFFAPKFMYQRQDLSPQYVKSELLFDAYSVDLSGIKEDAPGSWVVDVDTLIEARIQNYKGTVNTGCGLNHTPEAFMTLNGASYDDNFTANKRVYNTSLVNNIQVGRLARQLPIDLSDPTQERDLVYVTYRVERDVHCNLDGIKYYKMHNCMIENEASPRLFAGDVYITQLKLSNTLFREFFKGPESQIVNALGLFIIAVSTVLTLVTFGAATPLLIGAVVLYSIGITAIAITALVEAMKESELDKMVTDSELDGIFPAYPGSFVAYANEYIRGVYVESEINTALRQENNNECGTYYRENRPIKEHYRDKIMFFNYDKNKWVVKAAPCPEPYHYNVDFSRMTKEKIYFPLLRSYDCCSECLESFPTRVYYSEQSFSEENGDNFKVILSNNYRDIEAQHGGITGLARKGNNLFIFTEECLWHLPQNVQQSVVSDIVTFLGTGSYFAIPPRKVIDSDMGTAGTRHKWSITKTPVGIVYVSEIEKAVYLLAGEQGLQKISNQGMYNWFFENVQSYLADQFLTLTGIVFPNLNNPNNPNGIGIHAIYDPRHQRIIMTKRDYLLLSDSLIVINSGSVGPFIETQIYFNTDNNLFYIGNDEGGLNLLSFNDPNYFENKSFTISFSMLTNTWVSFHSYLPFFYYSDQYNYFSSISSDIYKHNIIGSHQKFYGTDYPYILETVSVSNPMTTRLWEDITLETYARTWDAINKDYYDVRWKTFNYITLYNSRQTTGELEMIVKDTQADPEDYYEQQTTNSNTSILIDRKERDWHINDFRDMRIDYTIPMFTKDWSALSTSYPVDKVINVTSIGPNKDWFDQESFRDKYLIIRLRFINFEEVELTTNFVIETEQQSFR